MKSLLLRNTCFLGLAGMIFLTMSGCIFLVAGSIGAVGGYAITRDTIQGEYDKPYAKLWKASLAASEILGTISTKDSNKGTIEVFVDRAKVKIEVAQITPGATRLKVKARKGIFPRLGTAEKVFVKILQQVA